MSSAPVRATAPVIDAHQHFWDPKTHLLSGLVGKYRPLRRPFGPVDLEPLLETAAVSRTVVVQADATMADTFGMLDVGVRHAFVAGVVGWLDPEQENPDSAIQAHLAAPGGAKLVGYRLPARDHPNPDWLRESGPWRTGISIGDAGLVTEFTMRPENIGAALTLLEALGPRTCVVDHMMTIPVDAASRPAWRRAILELAAVPNVYLKISGVIDDPAPDGWRPTWFSQRLTTYCRLGTALASCSGRTGPCALWPVPTRTSLRGRGRPSRAWERSNRQLYSVATRFAAIASSSTPDGTAISGGLSRCHRAQGTKVAVAGCTGSCCLIASVAASRSRLTTASAIAVWISSSGAARRLISVSLAVMRSRSV